MLHHCWMRVHAASQHRHCSGKGHSWMRPHIGHGRESNGARYVACGRLRSRHQWNCAVHHRAAPGARKTVHHSSHGFCAWTNSMKAHWAVLHLHPRNRHVLGCVCVPRRGRILRARTGSRKGHPCRLRATVSTHHVGNAIRRVLRMMKRRAGGCGMSARLRQQLGRHSHRGEACRGRSKS